MYFFVNFMLIKKKWCLSGYNEKDKISIGGKNVSFLRYIIIL